MLLLSSTTTATMFCCGLRVAIVRGGCHSRNSSRQTNRLSSNQTTTVRRPLIEGAMALRRLQKVQPKTAAAARSAMVNAQIGHSPSNTKVPLEKTVGGYLNKNSNIRSWALLSDSWNR